MKTTHIILATLLTITGLQAQIPSNPTGIQTTGEAQTRVENDIAQFSLTFQSKEATQEKATQALKALLEPATTWTKDFPGADQIQTTQLTSFPITDTNNHNRIIGYNTQATITIQVPAAQAGKFASEAAQYQPSQIQGPQFQLKAETKKAQEATLLQAAFKDAFNKAQTIASAANITLGEPIWIDNTQSAPQPMAMRAMAFESSSPMPLEAGENEIQISLTVRFQIQPKL